METKHLYSNTYLPTIMTTTNQTQKTQDDTKQTLRVIKGLIEKLSDELKSCDTQRKTINTYDGFVYLLANYINKECEVSE